MEYGFTSHLNLLMNLYSDTNTSFRFYSRKSLNLATTRSMVYFNLVNNQTSNQVFPNPIKLLRYCPTNDTSRNGLDFLIHLIFINNCEEISLPEL